MLGVRRKEKGKLKSKSEEKVVGFSSVSLFPARTWEEVTKGGNHGDRIPLAEDNPGHIHVKQEQRMP